MKITKIKIQKKNKEKVNIFIDGDYNFAISMNSLAKFGLYEGKNITSDEINHIKHTDEFELASMFVFNRLGYKMYTEKEIRDKIKVKEFSEEAIDYGINKAKDLGYINDEQYAKMYIEQKCIPNNYGKKIIYQKLMLKGIHKDTINTLIDELLTDEINYENCLKIAEKKIKNLGEIDRKKKDKLYRFLLGKGYDYDVIAKVFNEILDKKEE